MKKTERITKIIKIIKYIVDDLNTMKTADYFEHKNALKLLVFKNNLELEDVFRDYLPPEKLGSFEAYLRRFVTNASLTGDKKTVNKIISDLSVIKQIIKDFCQYKNLRIFYSWQSDLPNNTNRGFIQKAIQDAIEEINKEKSLQIVLDQDTRGECGSPDIVNTILRKIDNADVFIADVSTITKNNNKNFPNSNVIFELGYAYKSLGHQYVLMIYNEKSGDISDLPFDLGLKRQITYSCDTKNNNNKSESRKKLKNIIKEAIVSILDNI